MSDREIIEKFLARVEVVVRECWREHMKYEPYSRAGDYYPEAFAEVLNEMEDQSESSNGRLENTEEFLPCLQGSA